ncbi:MAG: tetratricopeptide repeat protein, partial [Elusimicrobia bacterium]|nr:tetratricopeptide repeat protein [Elusimicrobiota bacterium]
MGNAFTAILGDPTSVSGNPAGIADVVKTELTGFHAPLYLDVVFDSIHCAVPLNRLGSIGVGWTNIRAGEFEKRTGPLDEASLFSVYEQAGYLTYAKRLMPYCAAGLSIKMVQHSIGEYSDTSIGSDVGLILSLPFPENLYYGITIQNIIAPSLKLNRATEEYRLRSRFGIAYLMPDIFKKYGHDLTASCDIENQEYPNYRLSYGLEYGWYETLFYRLGFDAGELATGLGLKFGNYSVDYAVSAHDLGLLQKFSLSARFGYSQRELQILRNKKYERVTRKDAQLLSKSYTKTGISFYDKKQYEKAIAEWDKALIWNPQNKHAQKFKNTAVGLLEDLKKQKELADHEVLAHAYYTEKKWSDALAEWEQVLALDPDNKKAQRHITDIKEEIMLSAQEREHYKELKELNKKGNISKFNREGWEYFEQGRYNEAIDVWKKIFEYDYENTTALDNINQANRAIKREIEKHMEQGKTFYESSLISKAIEQFEAILSYEPGHAEAMRYLELARKKALQKKRNDPPDPQVIDQLYFRAADLYLKEEYEKSLTFLDDILRKDPTNINAKKLKQKAEA